MKNSFNSSWLSSILFLFYNVELLEICNSTKVEVNSLAFIDNVNMLVYRSITEENCKQLKAVHDKCLLWVKKYEALFVSKKYTLMHFSRRRKFNMKTHIWLRSIEKNSKEFIHMLRVWLNSQLNWNSHLDRIMQKIKSQINTLFKITEFIWNFFLIQTCQVYMTVVRPALIYKVLAWHQSHQQSSSMLKSIKVEIMTKLTK